MLRTQKVRGTLSYITASFSRGYLKVVSASCWKLLENSDHESTGLQYIHVMCSAYAVVSGDQGVSKQMYLGVI